jgi:predicted NUDIX family NTP pyrophosphohydrolase
LGKEQEFPEVDRAEWLSLEEAKEKIQAGQIGFIEEFERIISEEEKGA